MKSKATPMSGERLSKEAEERLLKAGEKLFRTAYPNPERSRRFDSAALKAAASRSHREPLPAELVDELTWSSETFAEYEGYLRQARFGRRMRFLAACAVVVVGLGAGLWWYLGTVGSSSDREPVIGREDTPKQKTPPPQLQAPQRQEPVPEQGFQVAVLDLRLRGTVRGQGQEVPPDAPVLPAGRLDLTLYLPIGSEEGEYEIAVGRKQGESLVIAHGTARLADNNVTLETRLDLSSFDTGSYLVGLRRGEFQWSYFSVRVE
jgi:hypothetical protein